MSGFLVQFQLFLWLLFLVLGSMNSVFPGYVQAYSPPYLYIMNHCNLISLPLLVQVAKCIEIGLPELILLVFCGQV